MTKSSTKLSNEWLPLLNYSTKHSISLSTLRRRIKTNSIAFKFEDGKYLIQDEGLEQDEGSKMDTPATEVQPKKLTSPPSPLRSEFVESSVLASAHRLVEELKSAYAKILQEKEEQITQLKEEVVDLRMLARILEENSKKPILGQASEEYF